jgi:hypothetical protein
MGDKIFLQRPPCFQALLRDPAPGAEEDFEKIESKCRTSVEWVNGKITENWKYITYPHQLKVQLAAVGQHIVVAAILTNALTLCNAGQVSSYFNDSGTNPFLLEMPTVEDWFQI